MRLRGAGLQRGEDAFEQISLSNRNRLQRNVVGERRHDSTVQANPSDVLRSRLPRVHHPRRRLDELLPGPWAGARAAA